MDALSTITPVVSDSLHGDPQTFLQKRDEDVHQQLEAVFMSMLIKEMRTSGMEEGLFAGDAADTFGGMFDSFMGEQLAAAGGIGIQQLISGRTATPVEDSAATHQLAQEAYRNATAQ